MGEQVEKQFTWKLNKFSTLEDECCYSRSFVFAGWNWHIIAYPKNKGHLSLYIGLVNPESLPSGWRRQVKFRLTLVNKMFKNDTKVLDAQTWFDASKHGWGFPEFLPCSKLRSRDDGFLVGDKLIIVAQLHVFPLVIEPKEMVKIIEPLSNNLGNQAADASVNRSQGDSSCQVVQKTENDASQENVDYGVSKKNSCVDTSQEVLDDDDASEDDGEFEEGSDDDDASQVGSDDDEASEEGPDDDDASSLVSDGGSLTVGNHGMRCNSVASETEISNVDDDDAPKRDPHDDTFEDDQGDTDTLNTLKSMEDANQTVENGDTGCINVASVTEASNDLLKEIQPVKETLDDVDGFQVFSSQADLVSHIFKRHPDIAISFRPKNQQIRRAYMDALLSLIEMLCQSPEKLTENDLSNADETLVDLTDAGFKLDWLKTKLNEITEKKKMEQGSGARLQTMEEQLQKLKQMFLELESQLQKEKAEAFTMTVPLSFIDVVS